MRKILFFLLVIISKPLFSQTVSPADSTADANIVFEKAEVEPAFPGGEKEWKNFIIKNLNPNVPLKNGCPPGTYTVVVQFTVGKDGSKRDFKALTNHGFGMEEEVIRVIKKGPKWMPGIQNGYMVNANKKQPFTFVVLKE